jgi:predicted RNA methylase
MITAYKCNYSDINCNNSNNKIIKVENNFINRIFFNPDKINNNKIIFTNESIYSSSRLKGSKRLIDVINKYYDNSNITITDGTANIGTDTINLSTVYEKINAVEISKINFNALENNIKAFGLENKINYYNKDINNIIDKLKQDIIYIDAPWGGPEYKNSNNIKLYLGDVEIVDFYLKNKHKAETFIFKVPYNYDFKNLYKKVKRNIYKHSYKKGLVIKYYLLVIKK